MKNKVLIISPYFAPENSTASVRFTKITKYLQQMGYDVTVICSQMEAELREDKTLEGDLPQIDKVIRIRYPELLYYKVKSKVGLEGQKKKGAEKTSAPKEANKKQDKQPNPSSLNLLYNNYCNYLLAQKIIRYIKAKNIQFDTLITTYSPIAGHMVGQYFKKRNKELVWIADFRDPLTSLHFKSIACRFLQRQGVGLVKSADYITTVSKGCVKDIYHEAIVYGINLKDKLKVITNGFDPKDREALASCTPRKDKLVITYCGSLYTINGVLKSDIKPLFRAINHLIDDGSITKDKIEINYAGGASNQFIGYAAEFGLEDITISKGVISRDESLMLQRQSDIIVVAVWNDKTAKGIISGKFYETLLVERNALCIITGDCGDSELASMVRNIDCGFAYEEVNGNDSKLPELEEWLLNMYEQKELSGETKYLANEKADKYSHPNLARRFASLFKNERITSQDKNVDHREKVLCINAMAATEKTPNGGIFVTKRVQALKSLGVDVLPVAVSFGYTPLLKKALTLIKYNIRDDIKGHQEDIKYKKILIKLNPISMFMCVAFPGAYSLLEGSFENKLVKQRVDIIHLHWLWPWGMIIRKYAKKHSIPYVITCHGSEVAIGMKNPRLRRYYVRILEDAASVEFVSGALRDVAIEYGYSGKNAVVINNGINIDIFNNNRLTKSKEQLNKKRVGFVGNLIPVKGADRLPDIFGKISELYNGSVEYVICGEGFLRQDIEARMKDLNVTFRGSVPQKELALEYNKMDVLVVPSRAEGYSCVTKEAQACGVTVVANDVGGISEAAGGYGIMVSGKTEEDLVSKMAESVVSVLTGDTEINLDEMVSAAAKCSWESKAEESLDNYKSILRATQNDKR